MSRLWTALRIFFRVLFDAKTAADAARWLASGDPPSASPAPAVAPKPAAPSPPSAGTDALVLLAALQREARLIDFLKDDLAGYADAQIGAAARDVHRGAAAVLERVFAIRPAVDGAEGASVTVPTGYDAARYRLVGSVSGQPPFNGQLCHHGWQATQCQLPAHTGSADTARILAPAEVEVR